MKHITKILLSAFFTLFAFSSKATHIVGGDITVKWISGNMFEVTLTFYRDCTPGNANYDASIALGVFDKITHAQQQIFDMSIGTRDTLQLGDSCYTPPNLCVEQGIYQGTISLPDNPNGYYISWHRCCRNAIISNINSPLGSGYVFYTEVPDPALKNSTPVFNSYPDAYMCATYQNIDNFSASDIDGDSLVYSLTTPLDCNPTNCSSLNSLPAPSSGPYGTITWQTPYSPTNILGDPTMAVNSKTGILTTTPPDLGVFVFCVRVEEYRAGIKIGEIRRDVQYAVLPCSFLPTVTLSGSDTICLGQSVTLSASGGSTYSWSTGETTTSITVTPTVTGTYTVSVAADMNPQCRTIVFITVNSCGGVNEQFLESGITLFPNPAGGNSNIQFSKSLNGLTITVFSAIGQIVCQETEPYINAGTAKEIKSDELAPGIYMVLVSYNGNLWSKKLIKE